MTSVDHANNDQAQSFDTEYIDKLFSSRKSAPVEPEPVELQEEAAAQEPTDIPTPSAKPRISASRALALILAAAILLGAGFLAGRAFPAQQDAPTEPAAPTELTVPPNFGYVPSYSYMSTAELAVLACRIQELSSAVVVSATFTPELYEKLAQKHPVLTELASRQDVLPILDNILHTSQAQNTIQAARVLVSYFTAYGSGESTETDPDIAVDYASMSTADLVAIAAQIDDLVRFGSPLSSTILTPGIYETLELAHPVLTELKQRPDVIDTLQKTVFTDDTANAATRVLLSYFLSNFTSSAEEIVLSRESLLTAYGYTAAPLVQAVIPPGGSIPRIHMDFGVNSFLLEQRSSVLDEECNFWFRLQPTDAGAHLLDTNTMVWAEANGAPLSLGDDVRLAITKYGNNEGWIVYGYVPQSATVWVRFSQGDTDVHQYGVQMMMPTDE